MGSVRLRRWQKRALDRFAAAASPDFLAVATPGAGKTTFALTAAATHLAGAPRDRIVVVAPTAHLKTQWTRAAAALGIHLDPTWTARDAAVPADMHGIAITYHQVAADPTAVGSVATRTFAILDEVHHAGSDLTWGDAIAGAFGRASRRLALSGTPFRSDTNPIPFVRYEDEEAVADFTYGYRDALTDGVVRPVRFPRVNGRMEWIDADGMHRSHTFDDALDRTGASQRLRTALSPDGRWVPDVLAAANARLLEARRTRPDAGGLVIAMDQDHARALAALLEAQTGSRPVVATSDDPGASGRIARFAAGRTPWLVAVRMVSEGVDIPRLEVGVYATNTTTELFFRQAVGRFVRVRPGASAGEAVVYIPDDPKLRAYATRVGDEIRHLLRRSDRGGEDELGPDGRIEEAPERVAGQLSLFAAVSSEVTGDVDELSPVPAERPALADEDDPELVVTVAPPPLAAGDGEAAPVPRAQVKRTLREANSERVAWIVRSFGLDHRQVNAELNRRVGIGSINRATIEQLERRLEVADRWLRSSGQAAGGQAAGR